MAASRTSRAKNKNNMLYKDTRSGFTIIEVVLVLAIAGLIFLMVFIALPQLQRAQRDTQRREDVSKLRSAIETFKGNNNGRLPVDTNGTAKCTVADDAEPKLDGLRTNEKNNKACRLIFDYMHGVDDDLNIFVDPGGKTYDIDIKPLANNAYSAPTDLDGVMYVYTGAHCDGEEPKATNNPRDYAIVYRMEGSGVYCNS